MPTDELPAPPAGVLPIRREGVAKDLNIVWLEATRAPAVLSHGVLWARHHLIGPYQSKVERNPFVGGTATMRLRMLP